jgi:hypothetical protein
MNNRITNADELTSALPFGNMVAPAALLQSDIMNKIIVEIYNGWPGKTGLQRVIEKVTFLCERVPQYAKIMGKTELETLELFAKSKNCNYTNYFQNVNFPDLTEVYIFDTIQDFKAKFPSKQYTCPRCAGISTDYQECNSGRAVDKKVCNWKVYGLFGDMGEGIKVIIKSMFNEIPKPVAMFKPVELLDSFTNENK